MLFCDNIKIVIVSNKADLGLLFLKYVTKMSTLQIQWFKIYIIWLWII